MRIQIHHILWTLIILFFLSGGFLFYEVFLNGIINPVLEYKVDPMNLETDKKVYRAGDPILVHIVACKKRDVTANVHWSLVDGILIEFPPYESNTTPQCVDRWTKVGVVPKGGLLSNHENVYVEGWTAYHLNDFNTRIYRLRSQPFKIQ